MNNGISSMHAVFPLPISYIKPTLSSSFFFTDVFTWTARQVRMYSVSKHKTRLLHCRLWQCGSLDALLCVHWITLLLSSQGFHHITEAVDTLYQSADIDVLIDTMDRTHLLFGDQERIQAETLFAIRRVSA